METSNSVLDYKSQHEKDIFVLKEIMKETRIENWWSKRDFYRDDVNFDNYPLIYFSRYSSVQRLKIIIKLQDDVSNGFLVELLSRHTDYIYDGEHHEVKTENENGNYGYVKFPRRKFIDKLRKIKKDYPHIKNFVDVGCGGGDKVFLAHIMGFNSYGIELNINTFSLAKYVETRYFYNNNYPVEGYSDFNLEFINGDAIIYKLSEIARFPNRKTYHESNLPTIYYTYVPIHDFYKCKLLNLNIIQNLRTNDIWWEVSQAPLLKMDNVFLEKTLNGWKINGKKRHRLQFTI